MQKYEIIGEVKCQWQKSETQPSGRHCYCSYLELGKFPTDYPEHFERTKDKNYGGGYINEQYNQHL